MRPSGGSRERNSGDFNPVESGLGVMVGQKMVFDKTKRKVQSYGDLYPMYLSDIKIANSRHDEAPRA